MVGNPSRWRASIYDMDNRNATAGCLLSLLFAVPYLAKSGHCTFVPIAVGVLIYVTLIVPLATGILRVKTVIATLRNIILSVCNAETWRDLGRFARFLFDWVHFFFTNVEGFKITVMQILFNLLAEKAICPAERLSCLFVLLLHSVFAYVIKSLTERPWASFMAGESAAEIFKLAASFMVVKLGKCVVLSLAMFTIGLQFNYIEPPLNYLALTFAYFCLTQFQNDRRVLKFLENVVSSLKIEWLGGMEALWARLLFQCFIVALAIANTIISLKYSSSYLLLCIFAYINITLPAMSIICDTWNPLVLQWQSVTKFPMVSWNNLEIRSGGLCAICLEKLKLLSSRVTPCGHVFHGTCLRRSLQYFSRCPLCKTSL